MNNNYITVAALTRYIKYKIDNDVNLQEVYIKGEISNFKHHTRGHFYFTIKDEESRINAIMFASSTKNINFEPIDGMKVLVKGRISVFEQTGNYQIYVTDMMEDGIGNLYALYEELKKKLQMQGLFDDSHKNRLRKIATKIVEASPKHSVTTSMLYDNGILEYLIANNIISDFSDKYSDLADFFGEILKWNPNTGEWEEA